MAIEIALQGAHLWRFAVDGREWLYRSPATCWRVGEPLRGGVPVCLPYLGRHPDQPDWPLHGPLRCAAWEPERIAAEADGAVVVSGHWPATLASSAWPAGYRARWTGRFARDRLAVEVGVRRQPGAAAVAVGGALHPYLALPDSGVAVLSGLRGMDWHGPDEHQATGRDHPESFPLVSACRTFYDTEPDRPRPVQLGPWRFHRWGCGALVAWNPGPEQPLADLPTDGWRDFCCLEAAVVDHFRRIPAPGEELSWGFTLEPAPVVVD